MKLYFSGLASTAEREMLETANVGDFLSDLTDWHNVPAECQSFALDSGAYRAWKAGTPISPYQWEKQIEAWFAGRDADADLPDFLVMPDILGNWEATWQRWRDVRNSCFREQDWIRRLVSPVWQWGAPLEQLQDLAEDGYTVCLGGLVPHMRAKDEKVLAEVKAVCADYGYCLHILGLNWLKAIEELRPMVKSCDTSKWLDGARYGEIIYRDENTGNLVQTHHRYHPEYGHMNREELCAACARNLDQFVNHYTEFQPKERKADRTYTLNPGKRFIPRSQQHEARVSASNDWMSFRFEQENEKRRELAKDRPHVWQH